MRTNDINKLGTFLGVFTPTILTILGVIMYLRTGWLVGHLGLVPMLVAVVLANSITFITTLSFSAVATNSQVGVGGAYYIISRTLGLEIGGAIGLPLFLSQAFSVTLYSFGLAESIKIVWPGAPVQTAAFVIVALVGVLAFAGAGFALKTQIPVMVLIGISLLALAGGAIYKAGGHPFPLSTPSGELNFWTGFAIFFPAVTGVMAGLGMSGDLRDSGRAIPRGAILAVITGFVIYLSVPVLLALGASSRELRENPMIWLQIAPLGKFLILPGLWGAIFSSAVGSMLNAPRTLQALAMDRTAPRQLSGGSGNMGLAPGMVVSIAIALAGVLLGDLNAVAPVVSMFFLTTYGVINIVAAIENLSGDPSWRPKIRIPWIVSLIGGLSCIIVMFLINTTAGIVAILVEALIWMLLSRRENKATWGDARRGIYETIIRLSLLQLAKRPMSPRNWRPHVLIFVSDPVKHLDLIRFGNWFSQNRGVVTACQLEIGSLCGEIGLDEKKKALQKLLDDERLSVFAEVDIVHEVVEGIVNVAQANGIAGIESNTVLLGWPKDTELLAEFLQVMCQLEQLRKSMLIGRVQPSSRPENGSGERLIHVWWGGLQRNGDLMLLLAYLLSRNSEWRKAKIQVMSIASNELMKNHTEKRLALLMPAIRIEAETRVIIKPKDKSINEVIQELSAQADAVFFGLATPEAGKELEYAKRLEEIAANFSTVFFVKNSSLFIGELLTPSDDQSAGKQPTPLPGGPSETAPQGSEPI